MGKVSLLKVALAARPYGFSFHDLHNSKSSSLPNETISCANADAHGCDCEVISNCFKHPSPYCTRCISLSITDCDDTNGDSEVEVPRTERFSIAASSSPSRGTLPASGKSSGVCPPCHSRTSAAANMARPHPEGCNRRPRADSAEADARARTDRLSDRTSSHSRSREMRQPGSLGGSHPDSHHPGWLACATPPRRGGPPATTHAEVAGGSAEAVGNVAAAGGGPIPAARCLW